VLASVILPGLHAEIHRYEKAFATGRAFFRQYCFDLWTLQAGAVVVSLGDAAQFALFNRSATSWTIAVRQQLQQLGQGHPLGSGPLGSLLDARNVRQRVGFGRDLRTQSDVPCVIVQRGGPFVRDRER